MEPQQRICIFSLRAGKPDGYIPLFLAAVKRVCARILVVYDGRISEQDKAILAPYAEVLSTNKGESAFFRYGVGLEYLRNRSEEYDEVLLLEDALFGPISDLASVFTAMSERKCDYWGLAPKSNRKGDVSYPQGCFLVLRKKILADPKFYAKRRQVSKKKISLYDCGRLFAECLAGYVWDSFLPKEETLFYSSDPLLYDPVRALREYGCPLVHRKAFVAPYTQTLQQSLGGQGKALFKYLKGETSYDTELVWESLLRKENMRDIQNGLNLTYVLSERQTDAKRKKRKIALILHLYYADLFEDSFRRAQAMPKDADLFLYTGRAEDVRTLETLFASGGWKSVRVFQIPNRGRDVSSLIVAWAKYAAAYDLACFLHDKKTSISPLVVGAEFGNLCWENVLGSTAYAENVIAKFEEEPRLGMLASPPPVHANYSCFVGNEWTVNFEHTVQLAKELGLTVKIEREKAPVAAFGTCFWFRPQAFQGLFARGWTYEDLPPEPNLSDGTLLHAIERIYPFCVQEQGYFCGWSMTSRFAENYATDLYFYLSELNRAVRKELPEEPEERRAFHLRRLKNIIKKCIPKKLYFWLKRRIKKDGKI